MTTGLFSLGLSLFTKQPVSINLSIAALVFIAGSASGFSLAQILGANLAVGVVAVAVAIALFRLGDTFARIVPPQIAIGVFAGTVMSFMWKTSLRAMEDPVFSAPVLGGFLVALAITRSHLMAAWLAYRALRISPTDDSAQRPSCPTRRWRLITSRERSRVRSPGEH